MDSPIMYYSMDACRVIPTRNPHGVVADRSEGVHSPTSEKSNLLETQYSRPTRTRTGGVELERIYKSRFVNRGVGVGRRNGRLHCRVHTPPRKIRPQFPGYKHISLTLILVEPSG